MKFLMDRCAGRRLAEWLRTRGYDTVEMRDRGPDPGDAAVLADAAREGRVLVTIDQDFGELIFHAGLPHCGIVRLPDVPPSARMALMEKVLQDHSRDLDSGAIVTVRGGRIRVSRSRTP